MTPRAATVAWLAAGMLAALGAAAGVRDARADLVERDIGTLLEQATRIEIVRVVPGRVMSGATQAVVVEAIRGSKQGDGATVPLPMLRQGSGVPTRELLQVCTPELCAVGEDHGGFFLMYSTFGFDSAVPPGIIERAPLLASRKKGKTPANYPIVLPPLCLRAETRFLDAPDAPPLVLEAQIDPRTGAVLPKSTPPLITRLFVGEGGRSNNAEVTEVVTAGVGQVVLSGGALTRGKDGCYQVVVSPSSPLARTRAMFERMLAGTAAARWPVARGELVIAKGHGVRAGKHKLTVETDGRSLFWLSPFIKSQPTPRTVSAVAADLVFTVGKGKAAREVTLRFDALPAPGFRFVPTLLGLLAAGEVKRTLLVGLPGGSAEPAGNLVLRHLADPR